MLEYKVVAFRTSLHREPVVIENAVNQYASEGWRVTSTVLSFSWWSWRTQVMVVLERPAAI
jgi:hypothetical protein